MNTQTKKNLITAIVQAQRPGDCKYVNDDNSPCCVAGQYFGIVGPELLPELADDSHQVAFLGGPFWNITPPELQGLQELWDGNWGSEDELRMRMLLELEAGVLVPDDDEDGCPGY